MADKIVRGRFVWHEVMTTDAAGAQAFYTKVLGWKTQTSEHDPSYTMFAASSGPLGGVWALESGEPHWIAYIGTDDIERTVQQTQELGGRVTKEVTEVPNGGKYALLEDPQGAAFGVYASTSKPAPQRMPKRGEFSWHELAVNDYQAAFEFYSTLFGWEETGQHDMGGPNGVYFMFGRDGVAMGGIFNRMPEMPPPAWTNYVRVRDVQKAVSKVKSAGGTLITGPMEVPGGDWIAQFTDAQGAVFAAHTFAADLKSHEQASSAASEADDVSPEETGAKRHEEAAAAVEAPAKKKAAKKPAKAARTGARASGKKKSAKKPAKKAAKKAAKKGGKKTSKRAAKSATKRKAAKAPKRTSKIAKKRAAPRRSAKKRPAGKAKRAGSRKTAKKSSKKPRRAK